MTVACAAQLVFDYLNYQEQPTTADAIMVFGAATLDPISYAYELYTQGFAPLITFISVGGTFGGDKIWGMPEAKKYRQVLHAQGVPRTAVVSSALSSNTLEESQMIVPFLAHHDLHPQKMILISRPVHQRRAWATFRQHNPRITAVSCPAPELVEVTSHDTLERLVQEIDRLALYADKGDLVPQRMSPAIHEAAEQIRDYLLAPLP